MAKTEAQDVLFQPLQGSEPFEPTLTAYRFDPEKVARIASIMVDDALGVNDKDRVFLGYRPGGRQFAMHVAYLAAQRGAAVIPRCEDPSVEAAMLAGMKGHETAQVFEEMATVANAEIGWATKVALVGCIDDPKVRDIIDGDVDSKWNTAKSPSLGVRVNRRKWSLIYIPTPAEAKLDGMSYGDYVTMFLNACDRPWADIRTTQQILIDEYLDPGRELEVYAGEEMDERWRTHVRMSIEGQTFANSVADVNIPGSEAFSSPVRGSIEGQWAVPNQVMYNGRLLPNIALVMRQGRVVEHFTTDPDGMVWVGQQLDVDEGAREVGEIAFGTNRAFDRPLLNGLYVEKVGGSMHAAFGRAYQTNEYAGRPVQLDNGVRSANHIDLTRVMLPQFGGGRVLIDGRLIQQNGEFLDPRLALLNTA